MNYVCTVASELMLGPDLHNRWSDSVQVTASSVSCYEIYIFMIAFWLHRESLY